MTTTPAQTVIARYLTLAGQALGNAAINVVLTETGPRNSDSHRCQTAATCTGCGQSDTTIWNTHPYRQLSDVHEDIDITQAAEEAEYRARRWAEPHAEKCRELPAA